MEPITAGDHYSILPRAGAEHRICGHDSEMWPCRASLIAHVEELEKAARQNAELCKADNAWAMESYATLKDELEQATGLLRYWVELYGDKNSAITGNTKHFLEKQP